MTVVKKFRLSLATLVFLLFASLLGSTVGVATWVVYHQGNRIAQNAIENALKNSTAIQRELAERQLESVKLKLQLIAADVDFVRYINDAQGSELGINDTSSLNQISINDLLHERQETFQFDLGMVLDAEGQVLARTDETDPIAQNFTNDLFIGPAIQDVTAFAGYWRLENNLYQAAIWPLSIDQDLIGFLIIAIKVDQEFSQRIANTSGTELAFLLPTTKQVHIISSSLSESLQTELLQEITHQKRLQQAIRDATVIETLPIQLNQESWIARLRPVDNNAGEYLGSVIQLISIDRAASGYRDILNAVAITGIIVLLIALPFSFVLAKFALRPLRTMARAAKDAASGNYQHHIGIRGQDALAQLSHSFDQLLSDLREKTDMENYVNHLSRLLPTPFSANTNLLPATPSIKKTEHKRLLLLGINLRDLPLLSSTESYNLLFKQRQQQLSVIEHLSQQYQGTILTTTGSQIVIGFAVDTTLNLILSLLRQLFEAYPHIISAMVKGEIISGSMTISSQSINSILGSAYFQLERLLSEGLEMHTLLTPTLRTEIQRTNDPDLIKIITGVLSTKPYFALDLTQIKSNTNESLSRIAPINSQRSSATAALSHHPHLMPGSWIAERYEILSEIGSGGMGIVYKARDIELHDVVALKLLKPDALVDTTQLERLKSEIKLARKITHPCVLRTYDYGEHQSIPYISMEYVHGMTLRFLLEQPEVLPYTATLRIARQLCEGLKAAHDVCVLHRDIKPENLILTANGNAKLMDFGIARPTRRSEPGQTRPGMFIGTAYYAAPEQLTGDETDVRADIYAVGIVLCEMFYGQRPHTGNNTMEIYMSQMNEKPISLALLNNQLPRDLESIILKCIRPRPQDRFQTVAALIHAIDTLRN